MIPSKNVLANKERAAVVNNISNLLRKKLNLGRDFSLSKLSFIDGRTFISAKKKVSEKEKKLLDHCLIAHQ